MRKMFVLENFASQGVRYTKGKIVNMEKSIADRFEKEGFLKDALVVLGIEVPKAVDLSQYVSLKEYNVAKDKIKELEGKIKDLEKQLKDKEKEVKEEDTKTVAKKTTKATKKA